MYLCSRRDVMLLNMSITMMGCHHGSVVLLQTLRPEWQQLSTTACGNDNPKPSFITVSSGIGYAPAWCSSCTSALSASPDSRMWQMQNLCSIKIYVRLTHLKDLEETIPSFNVLLVFNSGPLRLLLSLGFKPREKITIIQESS